MADSTIALARAQGYREGYGQALADVARQIAEAHGQAHEWHCATHPQSQRIEAYMHASAIVRGLHEKARKHGE